MKRIDPTLTEEDIAKLGGAFGPSTGGRRLSANRTPVRDRLPLTVPRTNHLPVRRPLVAVQRTPEA